LKIKPLGDKVIVKTDDDAETTTAGGIIIPDTAQEKSQKGEIVAAGAGRTDENGKIIAMNVKVGDTVLYSKYGGNEIEYDGDKYLIMSESDIYAVFE